MLVQIDGSQHRWLGDDHPQLTLHLAVDDATGKVLTALFGPDEDTCGYFELLGELIGNHGIPLALYSDRHGVFVPSLRSLKPKLAEGATQFARAMRELGIRQILASSPQAKGSNRVNSQVRIAGRERVRGRVGRKDSIPHLDKVRQGRRRTLRPAAAGTIVSYFAWLSRVDAVIRCCGLLPRRLRREGRTAL